MVCDVDWKSWAPVAAAFASALAAFAACANVIFQNKNAKRNRSLDIVIKKEAEFDSPRMLRHRRKAAEALLAGDEEDFSIDAVLDFMESVALYAVNGDISTEQAWNTFYYWFAGYYLAAKTFIDEAQRDDKSVWINIHRVHEQMEKLQTKRGNPLRRNLKSEKKEFLEDEIKYVLASEQ